MTTSWQQTAVEQLQFWHDLLGAPDVYVSGPGGHAIWYSRALSSHTFLRQPITWQMVKVADSARPLTIDARIKLPIAVIRVIADLPAVVYTKASAITTFLCTDQVYFVAAWATIHGLTAGRNLHRAGDALRDADNILRIALASGDMQRLQKYYAGDQVTVSSTSDFDLDVPTERSAAPRPAVRVLPNDVTGTVLERRNAGGVGNTISDTADARESQLERLL